MGYMKKHMRVAHLSISNKSDDPSVENPELKQLKPNENDQIENHKPLDQEKILEIKIIAKPLDINEEMIEEVEIPLNSEIKMEVDEMFSSKPPVDSADESGSNDEVDVTIPLARDTSPSKITDYFKPKPINIEEPLDIKVEYLYSFDNPKNWKPCRKCSICEKTFGLEDSLEKNNATVHEGKKAHDQATKQKLKAFKSSKKGSGDENNNNEAANPENVRKRKDPDENGQIKLVKSSKKM